VFGENWDPTTNENSPLLRLVKNLGALIQEGESIPRKPDKFYNNQPKKFRRRSG
jgi:hypothetical protein